MKRAFLIIFFEQINRIIYFSKPENKRFEKEMCEF